MNAPPRVGFLGRTFGWSGSRHEWLVLLGVLAWLAAGYGIHVVARKLALGESILLYALWLLAFGLVARDAIRNLFGPVFFHDIVRTSRQRLTFWLRWFYAIGIGFVLVMLYYFWLDGKGYFRNPDFVVGTNDLSRFGTEFFSTFIVMQFIAVVLLTPVYVAGTICVDKERKILEFLFATDLLNREIIFGKLASRVLTLLMYVLLGLPILAFVQLFGGVDPEELLACTVATVTTVIGLSALGIWFSTMLKKARDAIMLTYLSYGAYVCVTLFAAAVSNIGGPGWWKEPIKLFGLSIGFGIDDIAWVAADGNIVWHIVVMGNRLRLGTGLSEQLTHYVAFWAIASTLLLGHAILRLRVITLNQAYGSAGATRSRKKKVATAEGSEKVVVNVGTSRNPPVGENPVFWKEVFVDSGTRGGWIARILYGLIALVILGFLAFIAWDELVEPARYYANMSFAERWHRFREMANRWVRIVTGVLTLLILLAAAVRGAGAVSGEKDRDTWISLLGTPLSADAILWGKFWGCVLGLRRVYAFLLLIWCVGLALGAVNPLLVVLDAALLFLYVATFSGIGLYCSMTARTTLVATVRAFFAAIFCAGGFWLVITVCCCLPLNFAGGRAGRDYEVVAQILMGLTPPFVAGWLPMFEFDRNDMGPFHPNEEGIGIAAPILATIAWGGFAMLVLVACRSKFREVTNRVNESRGAPERPRRRRPIVEESKGNRYE